MNATRPLTFLTGIALLGLGGALIARAATARDEARPHGQGARVEKTLTIGRPATELYAYWRSLENLPSIMSHLERVETLDGLRSLWSAKDPAGFTVQWEAEIVDDTPNRRIAWRSLEGNIPNAGSVAFNEIGEGTATELHVEIEWAPPGGPATASFAQLFGGEPDSLIENDLRRFKEAMETGRRTADEPDVAT